MVSFQRAVPAVLLLLCCVGAWAGTVSVSVDRSRPVLNESFRIIFSSTESLSKPDFGPLQQDFQVLGTSSSSNMQLLDGQLSREEKLVLTVMARRAGHLTIPALRFGNDRSAPLQIEVVDSGVTSARNDDFQLLVELSDREPYVQSEVLLTVRLLISSAVGVTQATLTEPELSSGQWVLERLGKDRNSQQRIGGKTYQVVERRYLFYAQSSGALTIKPVHLQMHVGGTGTVFVDPFATPQNAFSNRIDRRSDPVTLQVRPIPAAFSGRHWLPATRLELSEQWSEQPEAMVQGQPVTRTLILRAEGLLASQLPEIRLALDQRFKTYPDQPELQYTHDVQHSSASRIQRIAIIPGHPGEFVLPAISLPWWNIETDTEELAFLPERRIRVAPSGAPAVGAAAPPSAAMPQADAAAPASAASATDTLVAETGFWRWAFLASLLLWVLNGGLLLYPWWRRRRASQRVGQAHRHRIGSLLRAVHQHCRRQDAAGCQQALLDWARQYWPEHPPRSLAALAGRVDAETARCLGQLAGQLYGSAPAPCWDGGEELSSCLQRFVRSAPEPGSPRQPEVLQPLYMEGHR